ncbi:MAG: NAD-dependent epimerase/dehydratase family protein [Methanothrix sp.]
MKVLVTGGAGFVGSHVSEYYARRGEDVVVFDNLSRAKLLGYDASNVTHNWNYLKKYDNIELIKGDVCKAEMIRDAAKDADAIIHTAAQTAVTTSLVDPRTDFEVNAVGTFNVLEAARLSKNRPCVVFCSTNKVYGDNVNRIPVRAAGKRYEFADDAFQRGISETFSIDLCEHTPYGASKLTGDIYVQDYAQRNEIDAAVFRMSCIYGTRQFGVEDQGWVAWFVIATLLDKPITIYGDGKQVRDVLYVSDLVRVYDSFIQSRDRIHHGVFNVGGGQANKMSLLELMDMLEDFTGKKSSVSYDKWRPSDQKVYISDIAKAGRVLGWKPELSPKDGVGKLAEWVSENKCLFA